MPTESPRESAYSTYHEEQVNPVPVYEVPITEATAPPFLPYRGTQMHGVDPGQIQPMLDEDSEGGKVPTSNFEEPTDDVNPVPVRIVGAAATEWKQFRTYQVTITDTPIMVVSQKVGRSLAQVKPVPPAPSLCFVGPDSGVNITSGFPLENGSEFTTSSEGPVWAVCDKGTYSTVAVHTEFATPQ
jgi:hypothetical protein